MKQLPRLPGALCSAFLLLILAGGTTSSDRTWRRLEPGLELGVFDLGAAGEAGLRVLRIDPRRFELRLLCASAPGEGRSRTARAWCEARGLVAAVNAGMYQEDHRTSVGLMRTRGHVNNPRRSRDRAVLAFHPKRPGLPPVQILDLECQDFAALGPDYHTLVQSIRMRSCRGENVWRNEAGRWNAALAAMDADGRLLLVYASVPVPMRQLVEALAALPLELGIAMYLEGGPPAQLYVRSRAFELELAGTQATGSDLEGDPVLAAEIPNILGVVRR